MKTTTPATIEEHRDRLDEDLVHRLAIINSVIESYTTDDLKAFVRQQDKQTPYCLLCGRDWGLGRPVDHYIDPMIRLG